MDNINLYLDGDYEYQNVICALRKQLFQVFKENDLQEPCGLISINSNIHKGSDVFMQIFPINKSLLKNNIPLQYQHRCAMLINKPRPYKTYLHFKRFNIYQNLTTSKHFFLPLEPKEAITSDAEFFDIDNKITWPDLFRAVDEESNNSKVLNRLDLTYFRPGAYDFVAIPLPILSTPTILIIVENIIPTHLICKIILNLILRTRDTIHFFVYNRLIKNLTELVKSEKIIIESESKLIELFLIELNKVLLPCKYSINNKERKYILDWPFLFPEQNFSINSKLELKLNSYKVIFYLTSFHLPELNREDKTLWIHDSDLFHICKDQFTAMLLNIYNLIHEQWKNYELALKQSKKSGISTILLRNMSHNIGSHVLSRMVSEDEIVNITNLFIKLKSDQEIHINTNLNDLDDKLEEGEPFEIKGSVRKENLYQKNQQNTPLDNRPLRKSRILSAFNSYLKKRMDFLADITTGIPVMETSKWIFRDILLEFDRNRLLLDRISGLNGFSFQIIPRNLIKEKEQNITTNKFEDRKENVISLNNENDILISVPNDIIGYHSLYVILENFIRNSAKHGDGNKKDLKVYMDIFDSGDYYSIVIFDNIPLNYYIIITENGKKKKILKIDKLIGNQNKNIRKSILDEKTGKLRQGGWGILEMKTAAAYLRKITPEETDNPKYESGNQPILEAVKINSKFLGYRFLLMKPKELLIFDRKKYSKKLRPEQITKYKNMGIEFSTDISHKIYPHKIFIYYGDNADNDLLKLKTQNPGSISKRIIEIEEENIIEKLLSHRDHAEFLKYLWKDLLEERNYIEKIKKYKWDIKVIDREGEDEKYYSQADEIYYLDHGDNWEILYESFLKGKTAFIEILTSITNQYLPISKKTDIETQYMESVWTRVLILDERIQEYAEKGSYKDTIEIKKIFKTTNIIIPTKDDGNYSNLNSQSFENREWEKIIDLFQKNISCDFFIIHLGIIEKMIRAYNKEAQNTNYEPDSSGICSFIREVMINKVDPGIDENCIIDKIVITSGRGKPHNLPIGMRYLQYSIISQYMIEMRSKYMLTQALYSARRVEDF